MYRKFLDRPNPDYVDNSEDEKVQGVLSFGRLVNAISNTDNLNDPNEDDGYIQPTPTVQKRSNSDAKRTQDMSRLAMRILKRSGQETSRVAYRILKKRVKMHF